MDENVVRADELVAGGAQPREVVVLEGARAERFVERADLLQTERRSARQNSASISTARRSPTCRVRRRAARHWNSPSVRARSATSASVPIRLVTGSMAPTSTPRRCAASPPSQPGASTVSLFRKTSRSPRATRAPWLHAREALVGLVQDQAHARVGGGGQRLEVRACRRWTRCPRR